MFNNPFLKKDPLLEAVRNAQFDGECRRQAEKIVNEEFGVYSRKAVVREHLAAYDAALETTYKELKEGWEGSKEDKAEDKKLAKDHGMTLAQWEKSRADKKHDAKEKKLEERDLTKKDYDGDGKRDLAKKDYDGDGKREPEKDEVWGSRFKAARAAGKMEEKKMWEGSPLDPKDSDVTAASKTISKAPYEDPSTPKVPYSQLPKPGNRAGDVIDSAKGAIKEGTKIVSKGYGKVEVVRGGKKVKTFSDPRDAKMHIGQPKKTVKEETYGVYRKGGSVGEVGKDDHPTHGKLVKSFDSMDDAKSHAKSRNKLLSPGEKQYYRMKYHVKPINEETQIDEVSLAKAAKTARLRNMGAERSAYASPYDYSPHIDVQKRKAGKTVDRIGLKHGDDKAKKVSGKMEKDTDKVWRGKMEEGRMPASVIASKQKLASMSDKEFAEKHGHKTEKQLRDMGARHGYGFDKATKTGSDHYVKRAASKQMEEAYGVYRKGGSIGEKPSKEPHKTFDSAEEAKSHAKGMNKQLSPGEKKYYRIKYHVKSIKEEDNLDEAMGSIKKTYAMKESVIASLFARHMEEQIGAVSVARPAGKLSPFGSAFAAARRGGQSNFSFGGKSFNTKLASSSSTPKATPTMGRTPEAAASRTSGSSLPSMAASTPAAKSAPAPVGKRDFASTLGRDVGSGPTIKPDAPKPPVDKFEFGKNIMNPPKADSSPAPSSTPTPSTPSVERGGSSNPPTTSASTATPPSGGAITQDAQKAQATTQDAGTPKPSARLQRIGESVEVGSNKYRIV